MKYAILSDIHAYPVALEHVLADAKACGAEKCLCLGDVVGYGPDPVRTLEIVRNACDVTLMGNHDAAVAGLIGTYDFIDEAQEGVARHQAALDADGVAWLAARPYTLRRPSFACAHGTLLHPEHFGYICTPWDARCALQATDKAVAFVGHTHVPTAWIWRPNHRYPDTAAAPAFALEEGCRYVVNVGSVGYPRAVANATYCLYDTRTRSVTFRILPFDLPAYARALSEREIDWPTWLTCRLKRAKYADTARKG